MPGQFNETEVQQANNGISTTLGYLHGYLSSRLSLTSDLGGDEMSSAREDREEEATGPNSNSSSGMAGDAEENTVQELADAVTRQIFESSGFSLGDELVDQVASSVVDQLTTEFSEMTRKSRPLTEVLEDFRKQKLDEVESHGQYNRKINYLKEYLQAEIDADTTDHLTSEDIERYDEWRKYESLDREEPLSNTTLRDDMYLFREFVRYMIKHRMVPVRFEKLIEIPVVDYGSGEGVDQKKLDPELAKASLEYLRKYRYADVEHVTIELLCESGPRNGGLHGRDVDDFDYDESVLEYEHSEETELKKDEDSEREVKLFGDVREIVQDYLDDQRPNETDENGREPLLTKGDGRISKSTIRKIAYKWSRPCAVGLDCPHDQDPDECEAAQRNNRAYKCPSSRAPHHIRTGYITDQKNRGVSSDGIEQRCDVSPRVQETHYDFPDETEARERYEEEFKNATEDPNSGYDHS